MQMYNFHTVGCGAPHSFISGSEFSAQIFQYFTSDLQIQTFCDQTFGQTDFARLIPFMADFNVASEIEMLAFNFKCRAGPFCNNVARQFRLTQFIFVARRTKSFWSFDCEHKTWDAKHSSPSCKQIRKLQKKLCASVFL